MKNNYNPFTVPDNFFEDSCTKAVSSYKKRQRRIRYSITGLCVAFALIVVPLWLGDSASKKAQESEFAENNVASVYEYDIFLQVNF